MPVPLIISSRGQAPSLGLAVEKSSHMQGNAIAILTMTARTGDTAVALPNWLRGCAAVQAVHSISQHTCEVLHTLLRVALLMPTDSACSLACNTSRQMSYELARRGNGTTGNGRRAAEGLRSRNRPSSTFAALMHAQFSFLRSACPQKGLRDSSCRARVRARLQADEQDAEHCRQQENDADVAMH